MKPHSPAILVRMVNMPTLGHLHVLTVLSNALGVSGQIIAHHARQDTNSTSVDIASHVLRANTMIQSQMVANSVRQTVSIVMHPQSAINALIRGF
jgi:hypothetical protein